METKDKINSLLKNQKEIVKQYEEMITELNMDDAINENISLKKEIEHSKKEIETIKIKQRKVIEENRTLKISLKEQLIHEKNAILNGSKKKIELYFQDENNKHINKLKLLEKTAKNKIDQMRTIAKKELGEEKNEILRSIDHLQSNLTEKIKIRKEQLALQKENIMEEIKKEYDTLKAQDVSDGVIQKKKKYNDIEVKIGLSWMNKVGVILVLLGVATGMKYTYSTWFNDYMKGMAGFLLGSVFLGAGEWFNRKDKNLFAIGLTGGGIGVLYLSVFSSYFMLNILNMSTSIIVSIIITGVAIVLSQRYKSMTICAISLIGGYLPFFSYVFFEGLSDTAVYMAMGYLIVLNGLLLTLSIDRRWIYINYLSFLLNIPCLIYLITKSNNEIISILYAILTFIMYMAITLIYPIREKIHLRIVDIVLLTLNTVINCLLVYGLFEKYGYEQYEGLLALTYAIIYLGLGQFIKKSASQEQHTQGLFYITAMTFSILMIPFQFGVEWAALGWLIEAIGIIYYGVKIKAQKMELGGWIILGLCTLTFVMIDFMDYSYTDYFILKYSCITVGIIYVFSLYAKDLYENPLFKYTKKGKMLTYYKYFTIFSSWIYTIRMVVIYFDDHINRRDDFYLLISIALITAVFAYGIGRIKIIQDHVVTKISMLFYILVDFMGFMMILNYGGAAYVISNDTNIQITILVFYNLMVLFSVKDITLKIIKEKALSIELYPVVMAIYFLGVSTIFLLNQFDLNNINLIISILFIIMSFVYIFYGFKRRFANLRRLGLGLSILSTGKLFIFDLAFLNTGGKIIAYFCFGLVLIGISYIYHKLKANIDGNGVE
ncbi:DUF2339 domain-containing protein [Marinisporobacter balticus]|uniref:Putative membrane protein DUF2339 n=1 Tax=Marinisporobacter balticus TaxID=2018667 RepID=A0A4R2KRK4_9FIRM|nr:DUF2339 domain-containing protein [Marinisporobacter balticus]TCO76921.1 putative membrane protein DUF2339 [Marinisporobacter balticus]